MPNRSNIAHFLLGFFAALTCAGLGLFESIMLHWNPVASILGFTLIPLAGALKSKQKILTAGLAAGFVVALAGYFGLRPHDQSSITPRITSPGRSHQ